MELLYKKDDINNVRSNMDEEKDRLRNDNMRMISDLNSFSKRKKRLLLKRDYVNYKYNEYGDSNRIKAVFNSWAAEYIDAREEAEILKTEYEKKSNDIKTIPRVIEDIKDDVSGLDKAVFVARYDIDQIIEVFPNLEEQGKESEEISSRYRAVHEEFEDGSRDLTDLRRKFDTASKAKEGLEKILSEKNGELAPLLEAENSLKGGLDELTDRFNRQEELREDKRTLEEVVGHLEKELDEKKEKIKNHEMKTGEMNKEIENLKSESDKLRSKIKEYEVLVAPFKELKERLESVKEEISLADVQHIKLTDEIQNMRKENEILKAKTSQYEEIKKMMEGI